MFKVDLFPSDILYELDKKLVDLFIVLLIHEYSIIPVRYFRTMLKSRSAHCISNPIRLHTTILHILHTTYNKNA